MTCAGETSRLHALARLQGIQTSYANVRGHRTVAGVETLRALLRAFELPADTEKELNASLQTAAARERGRVIDEVLLAWDGALIALDVLATGAGEPALGDIEVVTELGDTIHIDAARCPREWVARSGTGAIPLWTLRLHLGMRLPHGYHELSCTVNGRRAVALVISAPLRCYQGEPGEGRAWGLFGPLYALRSGNDHGAGSYRTLGELVDYVARQGGRLAGTLPLLPCYFEAGGEPSPYLPVTRLLWSEFYVDVDDLSEMDGGREAAATLTSPAFTALRAQLQQSTTVDYPAVHQLRRSALAAVSAQLSPGSPLLDAVQRFQSSHPHVASYAAFRATMDRLQTPWTQWPEPCRRGMLDDEIPPGADTRTTLLAQYLAHEQMDRCVRHASAQGAGLYLDLPVGVHPEGYDTWRYQGAFVQRASTGAPPDMVFTTGQRWGSPPFHPAGIRQSRYDYARAYLAHHMRSARMLRVDHVMGLHRIYCIPDGASAAQGAYLRYRPEEWYALLSLESHRNKTLIVGEDLGLVPREVHRAMSRHGLGRMFVLYYEMDALAEGHIPSPPDNSLASLNTHDMPPFAAMWDGLDICQHAKAGIVKPGDVASAKEKRRRVVAALAAFLHAKCPWRQCPARLTDVLRCTLRWLGEGNARWVMVNVEDLWLETTQQNLPGVGDAYPSWRHRAAKTMEELRGDAAADRALEELRRTIGAPIPRKRGV